MRAGTQVEDVDVKKVALLSVLLMLLLGAGNALASGSHEIIGLDFQTAGQPTPTNWNSINAEGTYSSLVDESGNIEGASVTITALTGGAATDFGGTANSNTIPQHTNSLAALGGSLYNTTGSASLQIAFSGLTAGRNYQVWVFGFRSSTSIYDHRVTIAGGDADVVFSPSPSTNDSNL